MGPQLHLGQVSMQARRRLDSREMLRKVYFVRERSFAKDHLERLDAPLDTMLQFSASSWPLFVRSAEFTVLAASFAFDTVRIQDLKPVNCISPKHYHNNLVGLQV